MKNNNISPKFINRELSWLDFNSRVLEEAWDTTGNPLLERLKFAAIFSSNLDEFFMVRVASIHDQILAKFNKTDISGLTPEEQLQSILLKSHFLVEEQYKCYKHSLIKALKKEKFHIVKEKSLTKVHLDFVNEFFHKNIYPVLTPMVVDSSRPFPLVLNKSLNIGLFLENTKNPTEPIFGTIQVPSVINRLIELPCQNGESCYILLEEVIKMNMNSLFSGYKILTMGCYRVTRNTDQGLDEEGAEDLLEAIEQFLKQRKWGSVIRLEVESHTDDTLTEYLVEQFEVPVNSVFKLNGPLDLTFLMKMSSLVDSPKLKFPLFIPQANPIFRKGTDIFETISQGDILLHHPYESFEPVIEFVKKAARDPKVLAIKQTLYRVSGNSPIIEALAQAAENGKQVTVLVELKARFDEQNNIIWAKRLEMAGCHVIYGLVGLKTHCKLLLVVRSEEDGIKRYVHLSTGNYNDVTAKIYTDLGLFTANPYFGADISAVFNMLSGYSLLTKLYKVDIAPLTLRNKFVKLIRQEATHAKNGKKAHIIAKLNSLIDEDIIKELYDASNTGVKIELIVRGMCCLIPGITGLSENITVRSIVGRYLEHSRIYFFHNNGDELLYLSSADWMNRNLDRRVELLFPIEDKSIKSRIKNIIKTALKDTVKTRILSNDGKYSHIDKRGKEILNCQEYFSNQAISEAQAHESHKLEEFTPNPSPQ